MGFQERVTLLSSLCSQAILLGEVTDTLFAREQQLSTDIGL